MEPIIFDWKEKVVYAADGPKPEVVFENDKVKVIVAGLEAGQQIPEHPESFAIYHFLKGEGIMLVDGERIPVAEGATIITQQGSARGMEAHTRLSFLATRVS